MIFKIYSVYDPEVESFDSRLSPSPLSPEEMGEQFRRSWIKMEAKDHAFMQGKRAIYLGEFDDETGKIYQPQNLKVVFEFNENTSEGEQEQQECQEPSQSTEN